MCQEHSHVFSRWNGQFLLCLKTFMPIIFCFSDWHQCFLIYECDLSNQNRKNPLQTSKNYMAIKKIPVVNRMMFCQDACRDDLRLGEVSEIRARKNSCTCMLLSGIIIGHIFIGRWVFQWGSLMRNYHQKATTRCRLK